MYIVYKHTSPSGKSYIGMTCQTMERRAESGTGYIGSRVFYNAIKKYGWDNFEHEILEEGLDFKTACEKEVYYIRLFKTTDRKYGYNLQSGGSSHRKLHRETRERIRMARLGKKMPPRNEEHRKRLSESLKGRTFSAEHCKHISEGKKGTQAGVKNPRARKVLCVETGVVFNTIKDAGEFIGGSPKNIIAVCHGRLHTSGGYHWQYCD